VIYAVERFDVPYGFRQIDDKSGLRMSRGDEDGPDEKCPKSEVHEIRRLAERGPARNSAAGDSYFARVGSTVGCIQAFSLLGGVSPTIPNLFSAFAASRREILPTLSL
jgi:hypothetical protein